MRQPHGDDGLPRGQQDVLGLDVPMDHTVLVGVLQRAAESAEYRDVRWRWSTASRAELKGRPRDGMSLLFVRS